MQKKLFLMAAVAAMFSTSSMAQTMEIAPDTAGTGGVSTPTPAPAAVVPQPVNACPEIGPGFTPSQCAAARTYAATKATVAKTAAETKATVQSQMGSTVSLVPASVKSPAPAAVAAAPAPAPDSKAAAIAAFETADAEAKKAIAKAKQTDAEFEAAKQAVEAAKGTPGLRAAQEKLKAIAGVAKDNSEAAQKAIAKAKAAQQAAGITPAAQPAAPVQRVAQASPAYTVPATPTPDVLKPIPQGEYGSQLLPALDPAEAAKRGGTLQMGDESIGPQTKGYYLCFGPTGQPIAEGPPNELGEPTSPGVPQQFVARCQLKSVKAKVLEGHPPVSSQLVPPGAVGVKGFVCDTRTKQEIPAGELNSRGEITSPGTPQVFVGICPGEPKASTGI